MLYYNVAGGSWANTQKLTSKERPFQLSYWDYAIGVFLFALVLALTMGSIGSSLEREFNWMQSEEEIDIIGELEDLVA